MIFQCSDLERALRSPDLMPDARAHAEHCQQCSRELYLWNQISELGPTLHEEWESPSLWPKIHEDLAAAAPTRKPRMVWRWALAAAATVVLATALWLPWRTRQTPSREFLTEEALQEVQHAEAAYAQSINKLSAVAGKDLQQSSLPLAAPYREKLLVLDSAISDLKANIESNRYNVYLQSELASLYREKQKTLQEWVEHAKRN